jgi:hypothetical protein
MLLSWMLLASQVASPDQQRWPIEARVRFRCSWGDTRELIDSIGEAGDFDGDGVVDLAVAKWFPSSVEVDSGRDGRRLMRWTLGEGVLPREVGGIGDWNADGKADLFALVSNGSGFHEQLVVLSGASDEILHRVDLSEFGGSHCASAGDWNRDGRPDLLVCNPRANAKGLVRILSGRDLTPVRELWGKLEGYGFGPGLVAVPDLDGDGVRELVTGAIDSFGHARILSGSDGAGFPCLDAQGKPIVHAGGNTWHYGQSVAAGLDVDGDGVGDLAITEDESMSLVSVYSGRTRGLLHRFWEDRKALLDKDGLHGWGFGQSLALIPDLDDDGCAEILVGDPGYHPNDFDNGAVVCYSGKSGEILNLLGGDDLRSERFGDFGWSMIVLGDLDHDGSVTYAATCGSHVKVVTLARARSRDR